MIERLARRAVERWLGRAEAAAGELPADVRVEREGDGLALIGLRVRLRALSEARIIGFFAGIGR